MNEKNWELMPKEKTMTKDEALAAVDYIRAVSGDYEAAHGAEDDLHVRFIEHVATRKDKIGELARIVLLTNDIDFRRYTA